MSAKKISKVRTPKKISSRKLAVTASTSSTTDGEFERAGKAADFVFSQTALRPKIALVLGSGLGAFASAGAMIMT